MADKYFTFMVVPERSDRVRKLTIPTLYLRIASISGLILVFASVYIFFDYLHVLSQVAENKRLRGENHVLRMDVQAAKNRLDALDLSVTRLKSFAQKLRIIGNLDSVAGSKLLSAPDPGAPNTNSAPDSEDSGNIEDPDRSGQATGPRDQAFARAADKNNRSTLANKAAAPAEVPSEHVLPTPNADTRMHSQLEYTRSLSLLGGELAPNFESQNLLDQINQIAHASSKLREAAELEERNYVYLSDLLQEKVDRLLSTPSIIPTRGYISSEFGYRYNPFSGSRTFHAGIDIANRPGTRIYAPADGLVTFVGSLGGFGNVLRIDHGYGIVSKYGHNSKVLVKKGDRIKRGDLVAEMGSSGRSTGPHLHYQVEIKGRTVNPRMFILEDVF